MAATTGSKFRGSQDDKGSIRDSVRKYHHCLTDYISTLKASTFVQFTGVLLRAKLVNDMTKPSLAESAKRNRDVIPDRVQQFEQVVKALRSQGILQPSTYGLGSPLSDPE